MRENSRIKIEDGPPTRRRTNRYLGVVTDTFDEATPMEGLYPPPLIWIVLASGSKANTP